MSDDTTRTSSDLYQTQSWDEGRGITATSNKKTGTTYTNGRSVAWYCAKGWAVAEVIDGFYQNHRYYGDRLEDALDDLAQH